MSTDGQPGEQPQQVQQPVEQPQPEEVTQIDASFLIPNIVGNVADGDTVKYHATRRIGGGTFGEAWQLQRVEDYRWFAGKFMLVDPTNTASTLNVQREVDTLKACGALPMCVAFIEEHSFQNVRLIVMEFCDGADLGFQLKEMKAKGDKMTEDRIQSMLLQVTTALSNLHRSRILHRDIKAENVLIFTNGLVKVGDFGLSRVYRDNATLTNAATTKLGSPAYMAPELWEEKPYGHHADMWALGVTLYACMTGGKYPFVGDNWNDTKAKVLSGEYPEPEGEFSDELRETLRKLLTVDRRQRPDTDALLNSPYLQAAKVKFQASLPGLRQIDVAAEKNQPASDDEVLQEGFVGKYKPDGQFHRRFLSLTNSKLTIGREQGDNGASLAVVDITWFNPLAGDPTWPPTAFAIYDDRRAPLVFNTGSMEELQDWMDALNVAYSQIFMN